MNIKSLTFGALSGALSGAAITTAVMYGFSGTLFHAGSAMDADSSAEPQPLYWVAPMDSNYRRDKPGKSPMGMDLVPVYANEGNAEEGSANDNSLRISPAVVQNLGVVSEPAQVRSLSEVIRTVGIVQYDENKMIHIHPRVEGWIEKLHVKAAGDPVKAGQPLYELYSPELVNAQQEFVAELARGQQGLIAAARERLSALQISDRFIRQLERQRQVQQSITFYAPQSGVVDNLNIREGFYVQPGATMMSISALDQVWVEAEIFERQASRVKVGQSVSMTMDFLPSRQWQGQVDYIYPTLDGQNRTLRARLKFANPDLTLKPNMYAQVSIHTDAGRSGLTVPKSALIRGPEQNRVVLDLGQHNGHGRFKSVAVDVGVFTQDHVEITSGLVADDRVVTRAQFLLDSESSKSSDFVRMTDAHGIPSQHASAMGTVNHFDRSQGMLNISRGPIEKWNRGPATLDFRLAPVMNTKYTLDRLQQLTGKHVMFSFYIENGEFYVYELEAHDAQNEHEGH